MEVRALDQSYEPYLISPREFKNLILNGEFNNEQNNRVETYQYAVNTGFEWMSAIYPPLVIQIFRLADSPIDLGYLFLISELITLIILNLLFQKIKPALWVWWLHPLPLIEVYLNKHYDL